VFLRLDAELSRSKRTAEPLAVVVADLDGFKRVDDVLDHLESNRVLRYIAFPSDGQDAEDLLAVADHRMYAVKRERRSPGGTLAGAEASAQLLADARY
jgi:GGDEF domain-containing protein